MQTDLSQVVDKKCLCLLSFHFMFIIGHWANCNTRTSMTMSKTAIAITLSSYPVSTMHVITSNHFRICTLSSTGFCPASTIRSSRATWISPAAWISPAWVSSSTRISASTWISPARVSPTARISPARVPSDAAAAVLLGAAEPGAPVEAG